jgi:hypothetical protein
MRRDIRNGHDGNAVTLFPPVTPYVTLLPWDSVTECPLEFQRAFEKGSDGALLKENEE